MSIGQESTQVPLNPPKLCLAGTLGVLLSREEPVGVLLHRLLRLVNRLSAEDLKNQTRWLSDFR
jgi:hypothetical protein